MFPLLPLKDVYSLYIPATELRLLCSRTDQLTALNSNKFFYSPSVKSVTLKKVAHSFRPFFSHQRRLPSTPPTARTTFLPPAPPITRWLNYLVVLKLLQVLCQFSPDQQHRRNDRHLFCIPVSVSGDGVPLTHLLLLSLVVSSILGVDFGSVSVFEQVSYFPCLEIFGRFQRW